MYQSARRNVEPRFLAQRRVAAWLARLGSAHGTLYSTPPVQLPSMPPSSVIRDEGSRKLNVSVCHGMRQSQGPEQSKIPQKGKNTRRQLGLEAPSILAKVKWRAFIQSELLKGTIFIL
ncbi:hypothetical protein RRG08_018150 [Elysia crispata]|uniref:Uncharacterized protein n=1 Tax=Elysia crispata TaxID=231223 RepID=A0AAE1AXZ2_9GAST|nr:hypothetical protein RRG08_018150 [Elysia crispata]